MLMPSSLKRAIVLYLVMGWDNERMCSNMFGAVVRVTLVFGRRLSISVPLSAESITSVGLFHLGYIHIAIVRSVAADAPSACRKLAGRFC